MNEKEKEQVRRDTRRLAGYIAGLPRPEAPEDILPRVMARIQPRKRSRLKKFLRQWRRFALGRTGPAVVAGGLASVALLLAGHLLVPTLKGSPGDLGRLSALGVSQEPARAQLAKTAAGPSKEVTFVANMPGARQVVVMGSFNNWDPARHVMRKAPGSDLFTLTVTLPRGRYVYAFLVDGVLLQPDAGALIQEDDGFGNTNSVLVVDEGENPQHGRQSHERPL
uniref:1,4-alpha-glucan branching enzyme n=1 Tax=Desulfovibrio sp. U5L TaxID=596152 RepID=I2PZZ8_9BACT